MRNNFEKLYEYEFNLRKIAEQECFRNKALADKRLELLRDALEFIDGMTLQEAELRMAIEKELADAKK